MGRILYNYEWISPEPIIAEIKEELRSYFETGAVDDGLFPSYIDHCLRKIGDTMLETIEEIVPLKNKSAILPPGIVRLNDVFFVGNPNAPVKIPGGSTTYQTTIETVTIDNSNELNPENPNVYKEVRIIEKETNNLLYSFDSILRLRPSTIRAKNLCENDTFKMFYDIPYIYDVIGRILSCNFTEGSLLIRYKSYRKDDEGYPLVPDHVSMQDLLQYYLRYKLFEQLWNSVTDESYNQMQNKMQYYEQKYNEALIIARAEFMSQSFIQQKENTMLRRHRFRQNYNIR